MADSTVDNRVISEKTGQAIEKDLRQIAVSISTGASPTALDNAYTAMLDGTNTSRIFRLWWPLSAGEGVTKYARLERWFNLLAAAWSHKTYTLRYYNADVSTSDEMTPLDDLANYASPAALATDVDDGGDDWAEEDPMTWYIRANALSLADGTMDVLAIEGIDGAFDIYGNTAPVYTFSLALWRREYGDEGYNYKSWCTTQRGGYYPYAGDVAPDDTKRIMTWHPSFGGGLNADGKLTSGIGWYPCNLTSASTGLTKARLWDAYEGLWNDCDSQWALDMWQLRHWNLENGNVAEGCVSYSVQKPIAREETDVSRVIMSQVDGALYELDSCVCVGDPGSNVDHDRNNAYMRNVVAITHIVSKEDVEIDGITYTALNLACDPITTTTTTYVSTMPWKRGTTEALPGHRDGSIRNITNGHFPLRVAGVELLDGAYAIGLDPLYNVTANAEGGFDYDVYECRDSENLSSSISSNYIKTGIGVKGLTSGWHYVKEFVKTKLGVLFPKAFGGGSAAYLKSAFRGAYSAGVRCPWRWGTLTDGGYGGLACEAGNYAPSTSSWSGVPRLGGSGKKRGEWAA